MEKEELEVKYLIGVGSPFYWCDVEELADASDLDDAEEQAEDLLRNKFTTYAYKVYKCPECEEGYIHLYSNECRKCGYEIEEE